MQTLTTQQISRLNLPATHGLDKTLIGQGIPIAITDYYTQLIEVQKTIPEYLKLLSAFGISEVEGHGHITGWRRFRCKAGHVYSYPEAIVNSYNPFHLWTAVRSSASKSMRKLESLEGMRNVYDIVLTYPKEVSDLAITDKDIELKCHKCFKEFVGRLNNLIYNYQVNRKLKACQTAISENLHIWKSEDPLKPHLHHHFLMLDLYKIGKASQGRIYSKRFLDYDRRTKKWFEGRLSKAVKLAWADCVNKHFSTSYPTLDVHIEIVSIDRDRRRLLHKLKYKKRLPLFDLAEYYRDHAFKALGLYPIYMDKLLHYKNKTHIFGYWNRLLCTIVSRETKKYTCRCPLCGLEARDLGKKELEPGTIQLYIDRKGRFWNIGDPP